MGLVNGDHDGGRSVAAVATPARRRAMTAAYDGSTPLGNVRHELFAQGIAGGKAAAEA